MGRKHTCVWYKAPYPRFHEEVAPANVGRVLLGPGYARRQENGNLGCQACRHTSVQLVARARQLLGDFQIIQLTVGPCVHLHVPEPTTRRAAAQNPKILGLNPYYWLPLHLCRCRAGVRGPAA